MKTTTLTAYFGFEYLTVTVPVRYSAKIKDDVIDIDSALIEKAVATYIVEKPIPIRGREAKFLRKVLGLSLEKFAHELEMSAGAILKWEKDLHKRIGLNNEIAVKVMLAERLDITVPGKLSALKSRPIPPNETFSLDLAKAAYR